MRLLFLALVGTVVFSTTALAQNCRELPPGRAKVACIQSNPASAARLERCREEGLKMGLTTGRAGSLPGYVRGCMQRGR